jgi:hypothetical protein
LAELATHWCVCGCGSRGWVAVAVFGRVAVAVAVFGRVAVAVAVAVWSYDLYRVAEPRGVAAGLKISVTDVENVPVTV